MVLESTYIDLTENDFKEHEYMLSINNTHAIKAIKFSQKYSDLDISPERIPTEMIQLCISTLWCWMNYS